MKSQIIEANKVTRLKIDTRDLRIKSKKVGDWMEWVKDTKRYFTNNIILYDNHSGPVKEFIMKQDNQSVNYTEKTKVREYGNIHDVKMMNEARRHYVDPSKEPLQINPAENAQDTPLNCKIFCEQAFTFLGRMKC